MLSGVVATKNDHCYYYYYMALFVEWRWVRTQSLCITGKLSVRSTNVPGW